MGCYGLGIGRICSMLLEKNQFLPLELAPFLVFLLEKILRLMKFIIN